MYIFNIFYIITVLFLIYFCRVRPIFKTKEYKMIKEENRRFGLITRDHYFELPLDYNNSNSPKITVFAREVVDETKDNEKLPWLCFFQGGPGFGGPRVSNNGGWQKKALQKYRVLYLDNRGTGLSSPITTNTLRTLPSAEEKAEYLTHFRTESIIKDAELIREELVGKGSKWAVSGQSYGGFCIMHYLSAAPQSLIEGIITGGVPSLTRHSDEVYNQTHPLCRQKNDFYYDCYPNDIAKAKEIADYINENQVILPSGDRLSVRRFQLLGMELGFARGPEVIHHTIEGAFVEVNGKKELSYPFLKKMDNFLSFDTNPIFAILHEQIYTQNFASDWSAERVRADYPEFDQWEDRFSFLGEMIGPWIFNEFKALKDLKEAADILAKKKDWPMLYDLDVLKNNKVPVACAVYFNDMFVNHKFSLETVEFVPKMKALVTSEYEHGGLAFDDGRVFEKLQKLNAGHIDR